MEDCRIFLANWAKSIMTTYVINMTHSALFDSTGHINVYEHKGLRYAYEIPCDPASSLRPFYDYRQMSAISWEVKYDTCMSIHEKLWQAADEYLHPSYNGAYYGPYGVCCYSHDFSLHFPVKVKATGRLATYRIRAGKFYVNTPQGRKFKSPTLSDYLRTVRKKIPYYFSSYDPDYLYDYWN